MAREPGCEVATSLAPTRDLGRFIADHRASARTAEPYCDLQRRAGIVAPESNSECINNWHGRSHCQCNSSRNWRVRLPLSAHPTAHQGRPSLPRPRQPVAGPASAFTQTTFGGFVSLPNAINPGQSFSVVSASIGGPPPTLGLGAMGTGYGGTGSH